MWWSAWAALLTFTGVVVADTVAAVKNLTITEKPDVSPLVARAAVAPVVALQVCKSTGDRVSQVGKKLSSVSSMALLGAAFKLGVSLKPPRTTARARARRNRQATTTSAKHDEAVKKMKHMEVRQAAETLVASVVAAEVADERVRRRVNAPPAAVSRAAPALIAAIGGTTGGENGSNNGSDSDSDSDDLDF